MPGRPQKLMKTTSKDITIWEWLSGNWERIIRNEEGIEICDSSLEVSGSISEGIAELERAYQRAVDAEVEYRGDISDFLYDARKRKREWDEKQKKKREEHRAQSRLEEALEDCKIIAQEEYETATRFFDKLNQIAESAFKLQQGIPGNNFTDPILDAAKIFYCDTVKKSILSFTGQLKAHQQYLDRFTIALFGQSMAGKSTFREAITAGDGSTIGKGAQNTTQDCMEYKWKGLSVVDTPGIGAYEQWREMEAKAREVVDRSDLVLFLFSGTIQASAFNAIKATIANRKPIIFVHNVKQDLVNGRTARFYRKIFLTKPENIMKDADLAQHTQHLQDLAKTYLGLGSIGPVHAVHAQAAWLSSTTKEVGFSDAERRTLYINSRIERLFKALEEEVITLGTVRRIQTLLEGTAVGVERTAVQFEGQVQTFLQHVTALGSKASEFEIACERFRRNGNDEISGSMSKIYNEIRGEIYRFVEDNAKNNQINDYWNAKMDAYNIPSHARTLMKELCQQAEHLSKRWIAELKFDSLLAFDNKDVGRKASSFAWSEGVDHAENIDIAAAVFGGVTAVAAFAISNAWNPGKLAPVRTRQTRGSQSARLLLAVSCADASHISPYFFVLFIWLIILC